MEEPEAETEVSSKDVVGIQDRARIDEKVNDRSDRNISVEGAELGDLPVSAVVGSLLEADNDEGQQEALQ